MVLKVVAGYVRDPAPGNVTGSEVRRGAATGHEKESTATGAGNGKVVIMTWIVTVIVNGRGIGSGNTAVAGIKA